MADEVYTDIDDLFERWAIMTAQGKWGDIAAMRYCLAHCDPAIAQAFTQRIDSITANRNALAEYIEAGYWLFSCNLIDGRPIPCDNNRHTHKVIDDTTHEPIPAMQVKDKATLTERQSKGIDIFALYPMRNGLIVIDLDRGDAHANKSDGIADFIELVKTLDLNATERAYFADFPANFPCYVQSAGGGIHLYFQDGDFHIMRDTIKEGFIIKGKNIEVKYKTQATAGGSVKNGKKYVLRGMLQNAPEIPGALFDIMLKAQPEPTRTTAPTTAQGQWTQGQYRGYKSYAKGGRNMNQERAAGAAKWNATPEGVIAKAREKAGGTSPHDFMQKVGLYFSKSGYSVDIALQYATQTPEHLNRKDKGDTITCIKSFY